MRDRDINQAGAAAELNGREAVEHADQILPGGGLHGGGKEARVGGQVVALGNARQQRAGFKSLRDGLEEVEGLEVLELDVFNLENRRLVLLHLEGRGRRVKNRRLAQVGEAEGQ